MAAKVKQPRKIQQGTREWRRRMYGLATSYLDIVVCKWCGSPNCRGYICWYCSGDSSADTWEEAHHGE